MKATDIKRGTRGMTLIEVLVVLVMIVILVGLLLPAMTNLRPRAKRPACVNNLKQVTLGFQLWTSDHGDKYPMQVTTNEGGSLEWIRSSQVNRHFMAASNEIGSLKVLICPGDDERKPALSWSSLKNENISYFLNISAVRTHQQLLSGDRHLTRNGIQYATGSYLISTQQVLNWGLKPHEHGGNIALTDGSVQQFSDRSLQSAIINAHSPTNWLAFP